MQVVSVFKLCEESNNINNKNTFISLDCKELPEILLFFYVVPPMIEGDLAVPLNKQVIVARSLTLECKAAGSPPPVLTWVKDGVPVKASDNIRIEAGGKKLEITSAREVDRGQYVCVATSVAGEKEIRYEVDVLGK